MKSERVDFPRTTASQRKLLFETWEATDDITEACRIAHVGRRTFDYGKPRYVAGGYAALEHFESHAPKEPHHTPAEIEQRVIDLRRQYPTWGKRRMADASAKGNHWEPLVSPNTVKRLLTDAGLWTTIERTAKKGGPRPSAARRRSPARRST